MRLRFGGKVQLSILVFPRRGTLSQLLWEFNARVAIPPRVLLTIFWSRARYRKHSTAICAGSCCRNDERTNPCDVDNHTCTPDAATADNWWDGPTRPSVWNVEGCRPSEQSNLIHQGTCIPSVPRDWVWVPVHIYTSFAVSGVMALDSKGSVGLPPTHSVVPLFVVLVLSESISVFFIFLKKRAGVFRFLRL